MAGGVRRRPLGRVRQGRARLDLSRRIRSPRAHRRAHDVRIVQGRAGTTLQEIRDAGLYKDERELTSPAVGARHDAEAEALNFCANNYLGLADHPDSRGRGLEALDEWGFGMASVRFICGTQTLHTALERAALGLPRHRGDDPLLLLLRRQRWRLRDALRRGRRDHLRRAQPRVDHRRHPAVQGRPVPLPQRRHGRPGGAARGRRRARGGRSSSPTGSSPWTARMRRSTRSATSPTSTARWSRRRLARRGVRRRRAAAGTPELFGVKDRVDIITGTLGKALGGASGGYVARAPGGRRPAAPAVAALPVLQLRRPHGRRPGRSPRSSWPRAPTTPARSCATTPRCSGR